jgi:hypothetical protein
VHEEEEGAEHVEELHGVSFFGGVGPDFELAEEGFGSAICDIDSYQSNHNEKSTYIVLSVIFNGYLYRIIYEKVEIDCEFACKTFEIEFLVELDILKVILDNGLDE